MRFPLGLKVLTLILSLTSFYAYLGQMVPQERIQAPPPPVSGSGMATAEPASLPGEAVVAREPQDLEAIARGKAVYERTCVLCHGDRAEGKELLNAPRLAGQEAWYVVRQLKNFASGLRGGDPQDVFGAQMRPMAMTLASDQEIEDVAAYLSSLSPAAGRPVSGPR